MLHRTFRTDFAREMANPTTGFYDLWRNHNAPCVRKPVACRSYIKNKHYFSQLTLHNSSKSVRSSTIRGGASFLSHFVVGRHIWGKSFSLRAASIESFSNEPSGKMSFDSLLFNNIDDSEENSIAAEKALTAVLKPTGILPLVDYLQTSMAIKVVSWCLLLFAGLASLTGTVNQTYISASIAGVYALLGIPEILHVMYELVKGNVDIHTLTTCAVFGTVLLGCALEGGLLLALFATANIIEHRLTSSAQGDLKTLWESIPSQANTVNMLPGGSPDMKSLSSVSAKEVEIGSFTLVRAGEVVPLDGTVAFGQALVTTQHITGEALPVQKRLGEEIPAGAQVAEGVLVVQTTQTYENSTPVRIARLTEAARQRRPHLQSLLSTWGDMYSKGVLLATLLFAVALAATGTPFAGPGGAAYRAFGFLSAAAPCAMLMTPLAYVAAIGACAQRGVLVRGGLTFDKLLSIGTVALDKTGTLTTGLMHCESIQGLHSKELCVDCSPAKETEALAIATAIERLTVHPIARAVVQCGDRYDVPHLRIDDFKTKHGNGVEGTLLVDGEKPKLVRFGNIDYVSELLDSTQAEELRSKTERVEGVVVSALAVVDGSDLSVVLDVKIFTFSDSLRERSLSAVTELQNSPWSKEFDTKLMIITGDNEKSARRIADELNLDYSQVVSGMLPEGKMAMVQELKKNANGYSVMMVGDGINDAPALAEADVGVAIVGTPSEAAAGVADILLLHKDSAGISMLPFVINLAHRTRSIVKQNLVLAGTSVFFTSLAALCGFIPLWLTVILHEGTTVLVAMNSVRLLVPDQSKKYVLTLALALVAVSAFAMPEAAFKHLEQIWFTVKTTVSGWFLALYASFAALGTTSHGPMQTLKSAGAGAIAGVLHTLTGPDHLAALAPLTIGRSRAQSTLLGGLWGMGHNTGQIMFGLVFLVLRNKFHFNMDIISQWGQGLVGVTLILIGIIGFKEAMEINEDEELIPTEEDLEEQASKDRKFSLSTFFTGLVHGLQPDALLVLLPALALPVIPAAAYLCTFLVGTVLAMASYTFFLGVSSAALSKMHGGSSTIKKVSSTAAFVAMAVGVSLILSATLGIELLGGGGH
mmetsp:Transcript_20030/g.27732  ORF Transcript_20030/g.27732 Transcript_20030/m.27732 type:complete len:1098 (-) Transcript_20030:197-3490(-)